MSTQPFDPAMESRREFLDSLPSNFRARAANLLLGPIRRSLAAGEDVTPAKAIHAVRSEVDHRLKTWRLDPDQKVGLEALREALALDCAHDYAAYHISLESLPAAERDAAKKQRNAVATTNVPPTPLQLRYLRLLHYKGAAPATLNEAMTLIARIKKEGK